MIKNYLKITIRHLLRQPGYTTLNILGLTIGIVSSLLIVLYLYHEVSFDNQHSKADRLYRISSDISEPDNSFRWAVTQFPLGNTTKQEFSEVEQYVRFIGNGRTRFGKDDISYYEEDVFLVDSTIFTMFDYKLISGNPETALEGPNSIVISQTLSKKIFKGENPIGEIIKTDDNSLEITGVYEDVPTNSHIRPNAMISASTVDRNNSQNWGGFGIYTYVLLNEGVNPTDVETRLNDEIIQKYVATIFDQFDIKIKYELINIQDIHLYSTFEGEPESLGNIKYIYIFGAIAIFLILIASINYMNLSTARSMKRALEVGIRKVMGAQRGMLIRQFITESILLTVSALFLSIILVAVLVPLLNNLLQTHMSFSNLTDPLVLGIIGAIVLITGLLSGSYPAFYLSGFKPAAVLKGKGGKAGNKMLRSSLVTIQFAISIFMLIGTLVIYDQMQYLRSKDLGFDKERVLRVVLDNEEARNKWQVLKNEILQDPNITDAATATTSPGRGFGKNVMQVETNEGVMENYGIDSYGIDYDYIPVLNIKMVEGRNIDPNYPTDTASAVLVNEAMIARMGWENAIGKRFQFDQDSTVFHKVIGVVSDFHQRSLYEPIEALLFIPQLNNSNALIKMSGNLEAGISSVRRSWESVFPNKPFEYSFLDEDFMEQYEEDQLRGQLFLGFSVMMIIISCLGLLGLASFIAEQRTKEISIRKVLGANISGLVGLLVRDFIILVAFGAIPAFGIAYYFMNEWLSTFEYHVDINPFLFILVLIIISAITIFTTGYHALRAATSNPANNLKYE
ncbi:MAG: ABC transporter permease [Marinoscillum sp.]